MTSFLDVSSSEDDVMILEEDKGIRAFNSSLHVDTARTSQVGKFLIIVQ